MDIFIQFESKVAGEFKEKVFEALNAVYSGIRSPSSEFVDLYLFRRSSEMDSHMRRERSKLALGNLGASFSTYHWAWRGWPCISVCQENCEGKNQDVWIGEVEHEAGHSILHGEPMYYIFSPPIEWVQMAKKGHFSKEALNIIFYYITLAVKDFEVSRLLEESGFIPNQVVMHRHHLETSREEEELWRRMAGSCDVQAETIAAVNELKVLSSSHAFLKHDEEVRSLYKMAIRKLTPRAEKWVSKALDALGSLGDSTHRNVDELTIRVVDGILGALSTPHL